MESRIVNLPWSILHYIKYSPILTTRSCLRLRNALVAERSGQIGHRDALTIRLKSPDPLDIRFRPSSNDIYTLDEVFVQQVYRSTLIACPQPLTMIDLGANIGLSSLYFLRQCPRLRVLAVEPDPHNADLLSENLQSYTSVNRATVLRAAVWATDGPVRFAPPAELGHVNQGYVQESGADTGLEVSGMTPATLIARSGFDTIDILKVDVEGGERHLFAAGADWLGRVNCLAVEFHDNSRAESDFDRVVTAAGFVVGDSGGHTTLATRSTAR